MSTADWHVVTSCSLQLLKQQLINVTSFSLSKLPYCPSVLFKRTNNFCTDFPNHLVCTNNETEIPTHSSFFFLLFCISVSTFTSASLLTKTFFFTAAMLSPYQSPVNCCSRKAEHSFTYKVNNRYSFHFPGLEFI